MLFNSYIFIFLFLPITFCVYFLLGRFNQNNLPKIWLAIASLFFYAWWRIENLPLILSSIAINFVLGHFLSQRTHPKLRFALLTFGIIINLFFLSYFKYADFFIGNFNQLSHADFPLLHLILPLGISFFTFTQTAYLVDAYKGDVKQLSPLNYVLFVTFFPHLIAGPILHHKEMMPQFDDPHAKRINATNIASGLFLFIIGLSKKVLIADTFASWASAGFDQTHSLTLLAAWASSLSYTFQLYFDFSGYTDMALGIALLFNIRMPINFNSPYKALNIQDFWRRWHITLSRFLRDYVYIPLGGNRNGEVQTCLNLLITFLLGGFWHGAGWTFIFWGLLHGVALVVHRFWRKLNLQMPPFLAWFLTFNFINVTWIFFRAKTWNDALKVLAGMSGFSGIVLPRFLEPVSRWISLPTLSSIDFGPYLSQLHAHEELLLMLAFALGLVTFFRNSNEWTKGFRPSQTMAVALAVLSLYLFFNLNKVSTFLYFEF